MSYLVLVNTNAKGKLLAGSVMTKDQIERAGPERIAELLKAGFIKEGTDQASPLIAQEAKAEVIAEDQIVEDEAPAKPKKRGK